MPDQDANFILKDLTVQLRALNRRLQAPCELDATTLADFREAVDAVRLTAWTVHELSIARETSSATPNAVLALTANERARRFRQMVVHLCSDLDSGLLKHDMAREALSCRIEALQQRLQHIDHEPAA